jgi:hypothetical protein
MKSRRNVDVCRRSEEPCQRTERVYGHVSDCTDMFGEAAYRERPMVAGRVRNEARSRLLTRGVKVYPN